MIRHRYDFFPKIRGKIQVFDNSIAYFSKIKHFCVLWLVVQSWGISRIYACNIFKKSSQMVKAVVL